MLVTLSPALLGCPCHEPKKGTDSEKEADIKKMQNSKVESVEFLSKGGWEFVKVHTFQSTSTILVDLDLEPQLSKQNFHFCISS